MARIEVKSEITGTVWKVHAKPVDKVESGDTLCDHRGDEDEDPGDHRGSPGTVKEILGKKGSCCRGSSRGYLRRMRTAG